MIKIGITGSIASGKTTASKILSNKKGPLFSADKVVKKLYKSHKFINLLRRKFNVKGKSNFKSIFKKKIFENKSNIRKLEKIIHPMVRSEIKRFSMLNKKKKILFYEIPLLIESKLMKFFDVVVLIKANRSIRLKRFIHRGGDQKLFNFLNNRQLPSKNKTKFSDHIVVNEKNLYNLKKKLLVIINLYV